MASPPILHGGPSTSADAPSISSALGVGEHLSIRIDPTMREEAAPRVAVGRGAATDAPAIHITIQHLAPAVDVGPSTRAPGGNRAVPRVSGTTTAGTTTAVAAAAAAAMQWAATKLLKRRN
uniref:Uncharacterized protein n=1 Tax=Oryza meridionalis TaxID=40149 RepID=A0A0E0CK43_9ORYZ